MRPALAGLFSIDDAQSPEIFKSYVHIINLALEVESKVYQIPGLNVDLYSRSIQGILKFLSVFNIDSGVNEFKAGIKETDLQGLEFLADRLEGIEQETIIPEEKLWEIQEELEALIENVRILAIPDDFKSFLVAHLFVIHQAVVNYTYFGAGGVKAAMAKVVGEIFLDSRGATKDPEKKSIVRKVLDTVRDMNTVFQVVRNGSEVSDYLEATKLLTLE